MGFSPCVRFSGRSYSALLYTLLMLTVVSAQSGKCYNKFDELVTNCSANHDNSWNCAVSPQNVKSLHSWTSNILKAYYKFNVSRELQGCLNPNAFKKGVRCYFGSILFAYPNRTKVGDDFNIKDDALATRQFAAFDTMSGLLRPKEKFWAEGEQSLGRGLLYSDDNDLVHVDGCARGASSTLASREGHSTTFEQKMPTSTSTESVSQQTAAQEESTKSPEPTSEDTTSVPQEESMWSSPAIYVALIAVLAAILLAFIGMGLHAYAYYTSTRP